MKSIRLFDAAPSCRRALFLCQSTQESIMQVGSFCTRKVITVDDRSSIAQAAALMREHHVGALVVVQSLATTSQVTGIVTDRDLVTRVLADPKVSLLDPIAQWAQGPLAVLLESDALDDAVTAMKQRGVRRLLVKDAKDELVGILSLDDLLAAFAFQLAELSAAIESGLRREKSLAPVASATPRSEMRFPCFGTGTWFPAVDRDERS
ncbi:CBS domain-containing protein [Hydrogenophaga sp. BPS33]|uniref:CBS domain-containing protein n=1 Tax=Hydrogenophaga sp. BPS33 TaxID=2651974 RepID=UPI00131F612C|nr:CBS domain-containing protein [Hydrogenophaga sp. BPS33]QHE86125.1 CBS domain-containing protein [Hydrogenophaga sp. BPS33]